MQPNSLLTGHLDAWSTIKSSCHQPGLWGSAIYLVLCSSSIACAMATVPSLFSSTKWLNTQHFILSEDKFTSESYSADYSNLVARFFMPEKARLIKGLFLSSFCLHSPLTSPLIILYSSTNIFIFSYCFIWQITFTFRMGRNSTSTSSFSSFSLNVSVSLSVFEYLWNILMMSLMFSRRVDIFWNYR